MKSRAGNPDRPPAIGFVQGAVRHRILVGAGRNEALLKAVGFSGGNIPSVIDATAGLGRDAFLLASRGAWVTLIERSPEVHRLLSEALDEAAGAGGLLAEAVGRMTLLFGDARLILPTLAADVVLVDPMHPPRKNSALVKQDMRRLRELVGADEDSFELMEVALRVAARRVVLKWPLRADALPGLRKPSHQILGKSTRYDVFMIDQAR
jgi:16S rRNA (guanine1516-N2)-methyltransferase